MDTNYTTRSTAAELAAWLTQFPADAPVFIGGTPESGYILAGSGDDERLFSLHDAAEDGAH